MFYYALKTKGRYWKNAKIEDFARKQKNAKMIKKCKVQFPPPPQIFLIIFISFSVSNF
jgi:hypothetical protein